MGACCESEREKLFPGKHGKYLDVGTKASSRSPDSKTTAAPESHPSSPLTSGPTNASAGLRNGSLAGIPRADKTVKKKCTQRRSPNLRESKTGQNESQRVSTTSRAEMARHCSQEAQSVSGITIKKLKGGIDQKYNIISELYKDDIALVVLAEHIVTQTKRVIKSLLKSKKFVNTECSEMTAEDQFRKEVLSLSKIDHPNVLKIYELFEDRTHFYIVSEAVEDGNVLDYATLRKNLSEVFAAKVIYQVLQAINHCHVKGIMHRSLQLESILLHFSSKCNEPIVKVTGFGTSCLLTCQEKIYRRTTSPYFIAPEGFKNIITEKSDVWSCGVILYLLLAGQPPFVGEFTADIIHKVLKQPVHFPAAQWDHVDPEAIKLILMMLQKNPRHRISVAECLRHPWIERNHWEMSMTAVPAMKALENLRSFKANQVLKQAVFSFITEEVEQSEESKMMVEMFRAMDTNGDGLLSKEELINAYSTTMARDQAIYVVESIINVVDLDDNGFVDYSEFRLASCRHKSMLNSKNLKLVFDMFDQDKSGKVSVEEIKDKLRTKHAAMSDELWDEVVRKVDTNSDGELDFEEFSQLLKLAVGQ